MAWFRRDKSAVSQAFDAAVQAAMVGLPPSEPHRRDLATYVVTGDGAEVLGRVAQGWQDTLLSEEPLRTLYAELGQVDPEVWVRWGRVLEASLGTSAWSTPLATAGLLPAWLELLVDTLGTAYGPHGHGMQGAAIEPVPVAFADLVAVAEVGGVEAGRLLECLVTAVGNLSYSLSVRGRRVVAGMPGFDEAFVAHLDRLQGHLTSGSVDQRLLTCTLVSGFAGAPLAALAPPLAIAATTTAAKVRDAARPLLLAALPAGSEDLRALALGGKPDVRAQALELLWHHGGDTDRDFALMAADADRAGRIRSLVDTWTTAADAADAGPPPDLEVPEPGPIDWRVVVDPELEAQALQAGRDLEQEVARSNRDAARRLAQQQAQYGAQAARWRAAERRRDPYLAQDLLDMLASSRPPKLDRDVDADQSSMTAHYFADLSNVSPVATVTVLARLGLLDRRGRLGHEAVRSLEQCHDRLGQPDLLTLQRMLDEMGLDGVDLVWGAVSSSWMTLAREWPGEQVWPFLARNIDHVVAHSRPADDDYGADPSAFYRLIALLPAQPPVLVEHLYALALGVAKTHRVQAQEALCDDPDRTSRAAAALTDGRGEVRTVAATWLARIADPAAVPALEKAFAKEKQDVAKGALLDALEAVGRPVEDYLDRARLVADAEAAVVKGLPKDLAWLAWDRLPPLHWTDSGDRVPLPVVQHLLAQAVRAKSPEPNAMLRKYAGLLIEVERQAFVHALLDSWIAEDIRPISYAEAERLAQAQAASIFQYTKNYPQGAYVSTPMAGKSLAEIVALLLPGLTRQPAGSAVASKGVLAVVAACGGRDVVPVAERYLTQWYGQRAAQGKAMIAMLAWLRHPTATQLLLSIGSRFRTKSFQVEATRQIEALAEREGWTVAQLADRTVPTAGFDSDGRLALSYGDRTFTARLLPDLTTELRTQDGGVVKSLPAARQSDDADAVKAAKASYAASKKELKALASLQQLRLYEALCTERTWSTGDWQRFLAGHPVMRLLCQRLVWVAEPAGGGSRVAFRLLDDGTLSDVDDNNIRLPDPGTVRLAHDTTLDAAKVQAWVAHLDDYEISPLFQQLGHGVHRLDDETKRQHGLDDLRGHTVGSFALRNRARRLGWTRGPAADGGWFHTYLKRFPTLGLSAQLEFTGNPLPEEDRMVAVLELSFLREATEGSLHAGLVVPLGEVPEVLLSETWHDVRTIAAEGGGHDPEWERKTEY